ncbi:(2Fe-2S)-binding protein [Streptomyces sp. ISL-98]|uniref:(2Fe-2S)-binding protein n=1 Tax=Streptomyces sp. ISL-98 TaxID=2819192 RepID=UPI001BE4F8FB|nr:(2Fe-2S)-binding protein [Streptomyces sp. ISL-98]MBT2511374.1 (2Fe-2S)-binding protein [Streptomyces sp. ISL-98]
MVNTTTSTLEQVTAIGPYFAVRCGQQPDADGFRPLTELYADAAALKGYVQSVGRRLGTDQVRVAASTLHLGTASRLWSIALASAALTGRVPDLRPEHLWWRPAPSGPVELWLPAPRELPLDTAAALHDTVAIQNLRPLADAVHRVCGVSPQVLRGNAASALVGALRVLRARASHAPHPVVPLGRDLLGREPLTGAGAFDAGTNGSITFRRRSCCLYYRVPGAGTCGDCVLKPKERTE